MKTLHDRTKSSDPYERRSAERDVETFDDKFERDEAKADRAKARNVKRIWLSVLATLLSFVSAGAWFFSALKAQPLDHYNVVAAIAAIGVALVVIWRDE
jgi:hypothetical protein